MESQNPNREPANPILSIFQAAECQSLSKLIGLKKIKIFLYTLLIFLSVSTVSFGQATITSAITGNWHDGTTWIGGVVPAATDNAIIASGTTVTLDGVTTIKDLTINADGVLDADNRIMNINGNLLVNGTYTSKNAAAKDLQFNGSTIDGIGSIIVDFANKDFKINANATVLPTSQLTVYGNINIATAVTLTNKGFIEVTGNITGNNAVTSVWTNFDNSHLVNGGTILATGVLNASAPGNIIEYNAIGNQNIKNASASTYNTLLIRGAGNKNLLAAIILNGDLQIDNSATFLCNNFDIDIKGNWTDNANFTEGTGLVTFSGTGNQNIFSAADEMFYNLKTNKSSGELILNINVIVSNTLTMINGVINTGTNKITVGTGLGNLGTLSYTAGYIKGKYEKWINNTGTHFFPIGASNAQPLWITLNGFLTGGTLIGEFIPTNPGNNGLSLDDAGTTIYNTFVEGYWSLNTQNGFNLGAANNFNLQLSGAGFTSFTIDANTRILTRANAASNWIVEGTHTPGIGTTAKRNAMFTLPAQFALGDKTNCIRVITSPITGTNEVCTSQAGVSYSVVNNPPNTYTWTIVGGTQVTGGLTNSITVNWGATGMSTASVTVVEKNACTSSAPVTMPVIIHSVPPASITGITSVAENSTGVPYSVVNMAGYIYQWTITGGSQVTGGNSNSITVNWGLAGPGTVSVIAELSGCNPAPAIVLNVKKYDIVESIRTGDWDQPTTWDCGCVPLATQSARIRSGHTVTLQPNNNVEINNLIIDLGGTFDHNNKNFAVHGDLIVNGTYSGASTEILKLDGIDKEIDGVGTIIGGLTIPFGNKSVSTTAVLSVDAGNITMGSSVFVTNKGKIIVNGNVNGADATSTWVNSDNSILQITGSLLSTGTLRAFATGNLVEYSGAAQTVKTPLNSTYHDLMTTGTLTKSLSGALIIDGTLTINGSSTLDVTNNNYAIDMNGNWVNNGATFNPRNGTVSFVGTSNQTITGTENYYNLTFSNSSGNLLLNNDVVVRNTLNMAGKDIVTGINTLRIGTGAAQVGSLTRTSGILIGKIERWINTFGNLLFPVGKSGSYNPADIYINLLTTPGSILGEFIPADPGSAGLPLVDGAATVFNQFTEGYWSFKALNGFSASNYNVDLNGSNFNSYLVNINTRVLKRTNGGNWVADGTHVAAIPPVAYRNGLTGGISALGTQFGLGFVCAPANISGIVTPATCFGSTNGAISITVTGGSAPYTYSWVPGGATTKDISGLAAGSYGVTVTDALGCITPAIFIVLQPAQMTINEVITNVSCLQTNNGAIDITVSGGTIPYIYGWTTFDGSGLIPTNEDQTGLTIGTYTVLALDVNGCSVLKSLTVAKSLPPAPITGTLNVCIGSTTTLSDATPGGVWSSGSPAIATIDAGGIVSGLSVGTSIISYTVGLDCISTATVTVDPMPAPITGTLDVCVGSTTTLKDVTPGGLWTSSNLAVATVDAGGIVTAVSVGNTTITYTVSSCFVTALVNVNPLPAPITGVLDVCVGSTTKLSDATPGGTWSSATPAVATIDAIGKVTGVSGGTSVISYTMATGCDITATVTVHPSPTVTITNPAPVCSPATVDITVAAVTAGSTPGLTFTYWTDAAATVPYGTPTTASAGTYYIKGTDASGCFDIKPVTVTVNPVPTVTITNPAPACFPNTVDITAAAVTAGSTPGLIFTYWTDAAATIPYATPTTASAGTYYIKGTDASGCFDIKPVTVTVNPSPTVTITDPAPVCSPATVDITAAAVTAGSTPGLIFTYWTDAAATIPYATPTTASAGTYYIKGTDGSGCFDIKPVIVTVNPLPQGSLTANGPFCASGAGMLTWTATSGTGPYTVIYNDGVANRTANAVVSGTPFATFTTPVIATTTYTLVSVTDASGCIRAAGFTGGSATITVKPLPQGSLTANGPFCASGAGMLTWTATSGTGPYTVIYNDGVANRTANAVVSGTPFATFTTPVIATTTYTLVSVTDASGCIRAAGFTGGSATITVNPLPQGSLTANGPFCASGAGMLTWTATSGTGPYTVIYNDGVANRTANAVVSGTPFATFTTTVIATTTYTLVSVTDASGCIRAAGFTGGSATITVKPLPQGSLTANGPFCASGAGMLTWTATSGTGPYTVIYNDGVANRTANAVVSGTPFATFTTPVIATTTYTLVSVTDASGCIRAAGFTGGSATITVKPLPQGSLTANGPFCASGAGMLTWTATSGTGPYTVIYNDGVANRTANAVVSGTPFATFTTPVIATTTYTLVSVTDASGCIRAAGFTGGSATITVKPLPQGSLTANGPFCASGAGMLTWTATSGTGPYTVIYNDGVANRTANAVVSGTPFATFTTPVIATTTYTLVSVTDASGCIRAAGFTGGSATITVNPLPQGSLTANGPFCASGAGMLTWTATSGTGPYTVIYNDGVANRTANAVVSGTPFATFTTPVIATTTYTLVSVTDASGCIRAAGFTGGSATITVNPLPQGSLTANGPFCASGAGMLTWTATSGTGPYTVIYNDGVANRTANAVVSGTPFATFTTPVIATTTYTLVSVTDASGCIRAAGFTGGSATITVKPLPQGSLTANGPFCASGAGMLTWTATSGTGPYTVIYNDGVANRTANAVVSGTPFATFTTPVIATTTYTLVSVTDASGCIRAAGFTGGSATITVNPLPQGSLTANGPFCASGAGMLTWTATSGTGPYTVIYNDGVANRTANAVVSGTPFATFTTPVIATTTYTLVSVTDASGCIRAAGFTGGSATITVNPLPQGSLTANGPFCASGAGMLTWTATSGTGPYTVIYNDGVANRTANAVVSGTPFATFTTPVIATTTYTLVSVTDASGCIRAAGFTGGSATITVKPLPQGSLTANGPFCASGAGMLTWTATSGTGPYTVIYNDGVANRTANAVVSGTPFATFTTPVIATTTYTLVSVTDASGCIRAAGFTGGSATITVNPLPQGSLTANGPFCASGAGMLTWTATSGTGPYTVIYNDGVANRTANAVVSGTPFATFTTPVIATTTYTLVSVTDASGCIRAAGFTGGSATITVNPLPQGSLTANGPFCASGAGMLTWTATSGTGPYTVIYNDGVANRTANAVVSGTPFATFTTPVIATTTYTLVSVTDASGCIRAAGFTGGSATITVKPLPQGSLTANGPFCASGAGMLTWTATSGTGPYTVIYNDGVANRTANAVVSGTPFATFTTPVIATTTYTLVSVTDASGCIRAAGFTGGSATITVNPLPQGSLTANGPFCASGAGMLTWTATSGTGPYTVIYNDGVANRTANAVVSGTPFATFTTPVIATTTYTLVSVTDASGCIRAAGFTGGSATITVNPLPQGSLTANGPFCASGAGMLTWTATSGTGPYTVIYNDGVANRTANAVVSGTPFATFTTPVIATTTYTLVSVTDASGCIRAAGFTGGSATITVNPLPPTPVASVTIQPTCLVPTGTIVVTAPLGAQYEYAIDLGTYQVSPTFTLVPAGNHTITAILTASPTCVSLPSANLTVNAVPVAPVVIITNPAPVCSPGTVDITAPAVTAGSSPGLIFTYWTDAAATIPYVTPTTASAGTYYIKGTDPISGCIDIKPVTVTVNPVPTVTITNPAPACSPNTVDITAAAVTAGSTPGLTFTYWTDAAATIPYATPTTASAGTYYIKGTDGSGCFDIKPVTVTVNPSPTVTITNPAPVCSPNTVDITAAAVTAGSTPGLTFTYWTDAAATIPFATPTTASAGTYYIKGTDGSGCFDIKPVTVTVNPSPTVTITNPAPACFPNTVDITAPAVTAGSTPGLTFTYWTDAAATTPYATPTTASAGTYYIKGTDASGCFDIKPVTVTVNPVPTVTITNPAPACSPNTVDITAAAVTAGSTPGLIFTYWTDAAATNPYATPTTASAGTYYIKGTDGSGCFDIKPVTVTVNPSPTVTITDPAPACSPNTVDITAAAVTAGSTPGLTFTYWTDAAATIPYATPTTASTGTYYIKGADGSGCFDIKPVTVTVNPAPAVTVTDPAPACSPATVDITAAAVTAGSTPGLTFTYWTDAAATIPYATPTTASAGTYYIKGTDASGCFDIKPVTVTVNPSPTVTITDPAPVCSPATVDITAAAVTAGSTPGLIFTYWTDAAATIPYATPTTASAGTYYIMGTDASGCFDIKPVTVTVNPSPTVTSTQTDVLCFGSATGAIDITPAGGTSPYTYLWTGTGVIVASEDQNGLTAGTYTVVVSDANGCSSAPLSVTLTEPASAVSGSITSQTNVSVFGGNDGSVTVDGSGGTPPYQYKLGAGAYQASGTFGTLTAGLYTVTVQDNNLCTFDVPVTITQPTQPLSGNITSQTNVACFGGATGSVTVAAIGGVSPFEFSLDGGAYQPSGTFNALAAGNYTVTIRDATASTFDVSVIITEPASALGGSINSQTDVLCFGSNTGIVIVTGTGGTAPYQYKLPTGTYQASGTFGSLVAGTYLITIQDANLCTFDITVNITQPAAILSGSIVTQVNASCSGSATGSVTVLGAGGVSPYEYSFNGGAFQPSGVFSGLAAGTYSVGIRDANLCTVNVPVTITEPSALSVDASNTDATCPGVPDGSITLTVTGGTQPYNVLWSDGASTANRASIADGTYSAVITDMNGCATSIDVTIRFTGTEECLEIPEIITPDNNGFNDTWKIKNIDLFPNAEVFVYTRWGKLVFNSKNLAANPWNGTYKGKLLPTDSYHYVLHLGDGSKPRSGVISIIR